MKKDWRFRALIRELGGIGPVTDLLNKHVCDNHLSFETVKGWATRNSIPSQYLPYLLIHAIDKGYIDGVKFLKVKSGHDL